MMPTCREATELLSQQQDRPLRWTEVLRLRLHLALCDGCRAFGRQLDFLRRAVRRHRDGD